MLTERDKMFRQEKTEKEKQTEIAEKYFDCLLSQISAGLVEEVNYENDSRRLKRIYPDEVVKTKHTVTWYTYD